MGRDNRQQAYEYLIDLANKQGYVTFDEIMDCADDHDLPIQDFDWLSNSITSRGILVYSEAPSSASATDEDEYDDFAQSDYEAVYNRIIELSPSLEPFVNGVRDIIPPQRHEIKQLKYQIVDGNEYARSRMIEMHLRIALRVALQRAEAFDMDIEDAIGYACIGLTIAVDKYDPDTSGAFASYATLWILQNISREQSTRRPLVYYPVHQKENYFSMHPILKSHGCIECDDLWQCEKARQMVMDKLECSDKDVERTIAQMIPDSRIEDLLNLYSGEYGENDDVMVGSMLGSISPDTVVSDEDVLQAIYDKILGEVVADALKKLTPREEEILKLRYGFDGPEQTLEQVGSRYNITRERIRQIEAKALIKLCHPARSKKLRAYQ